MRLPRFRPRTLRALQVEVTSRCTRRCAVCPRGALGESWLEGDLAAPTWKRLRPDLRLARHVHLQGWGEPLLHPQLRSMVRDARDAGCRVGITTNGDLLDGAIEWIVSDELDLLTVSVAGKARHHARLRDGADLEQTWAQLRRLASIRRRKPRLQVSCLLTRENLPDLPQTVAEAAAVGCDEVFAIHLDCTPSEELLARSAIDDPELSRVVEAARKVARAARIRFRGPAVSPLEILTCALDPRRFAYVAWDGSVGPCAYLLMPIEGAIPRATGTGQVGVEPVVYGNLAQASLEELLRGEQRRRFCEPFAARLEAEGRFRQAPDGLWGNVAVEAVERADRQRALDLEDNPFPGPCHGCHKASGW